MLTKIAQSHAFRRCRRRFIAGSFVGVIVAVQGPGSVFDLSVAYAQAVLSLDDAVAKVRKQTGGRVLSAEKTQSNDLPVYRIKILTKDGRVKIYTVDPITGKIIN